MRNPTNLTRNASLSTNSKTGRRSLLFHWSGIIIFLMLSFSLKVSADDIADLLKRAYAHSWEGKFVSAENEFLTVLSQQPENLDALNGLGYTYAWSKQFKKARVRFTKSLKVDPDNLSAQKGLAFIAFWSGHNREAINLFSRLMEKFPQDAEIAASLGHVYLTEGRQRAARKAYRKALAIDPDRQDAIDGLVAIAESPPLLDIDFRVGYTSFEQENGLGIRGSNIGYWPNRDTKVWLRFDNSLSLDNSVLLRADESVSAFYAGLFKNFGGRVFANIEIGRRSLRGEDQMIYQIEQTAFLTTSTFIKTGVVFITHSEDNRNVDFSLLGGFGKRLLPKYTVEPVFFYTRNDDSNSTESRLIINNDLTLSSRFKLNGGIGFGRLSTPLDEQSSNITTGFLQLSTLLNPSHRLFFLLRHESLPSQSFSVVSLGFKFRLEKR